jgi:hypothetical protein
VLKREQGLSAARREDDKSSHSISRNRLFITCSFGLLPPPASQLWSLPTLTVCSVSGCLARMVSPERAAKTGGH